MSAIGPIVIIDNDHEDHELLKLAFGKLGLKNRLIFFSDWHEALHFLQDTTENPFLILSDLKMPKMDGLELRRAINNNSYLRKKSIPFIFLAEHADPEEVSAAYDLNVQGFFTKANSIEELEEKLRMITGYWRKCVEPNQV
jgi:CheY-like chemotaxis protein